MKSFLAGILTALAIAAIAVSGTDRALAQAEAQATVTLEQAVQQGLVKVDVSACGGAYGDAIEVTVQRQVGHSVNVVVEPGTVFVAVGGDVQNMVGARVKGEMLDAQNYRPTEVMVLADGARRTFLVEAFCLDYHKPAPKTNDGFSMAAKDPRAARILVNTPRAKVSVEATQSALWMDRSGVSPEELQRKYGFSSVDVRVGGDIVQRVAEIARAAIPANLPENVRVNVETLLGSDPAAREQAAAQLRAMGPQAGPVMSLLNENSLAVRPLRVAIGSATGAMPEGTPGGVNVEVGGVDVEVGGGPAGTGVRVDVEGAAQALQAMIGKPSLEPMVASLKSPLLLMRRNAARSLGATKDPRAIEPLIVALGDSDDRVRTLAAESLKQITGQDIGVDRPKWMEWWEKNKSDLLKEQEATPKPQLPDPQ